MATAALVFYGMFIVLGGFGWRSYRQWRRTGSTGMRGFHGRPGSLEWLAGAGFVVAIVAGALAPMLQVAGLLSPVVTLDAPPYLRRSGRWRRWWVSPRHCGRKSRWVTRGASASTPAKPPDSSRVGCLGGCATPIFTAMLVFGAGVALMAPNPLALIGFVLLLTSIELQVRFVEEPYLHRTHSERYRDYVSRVGRFVPRIG